MNHNVGLVAQIDGRSVSDLGTESYEEELVLYEKCHMIRESTAAFFTRDTTTREIGKFLKYVCTGKTT